jgi:hypothetical protein
MKVELKGIEIAMGEKSARLTIAEAKELQKQLNELFNEKITYVPSAPVIIEREVWPWWRRYPDYNQPYWTTVTSAPEPIGITTYCCTEEAK